MTADIVRLHPREHQIGDLVQLDLAGTLHDGVITMRRGDRFTVHMGPRTFVRDITPADIANNLTRQMEA